MKKKRNKNLAESVLDEPSSIVKEEQYVSMAKRFISLLVLATHNCAALTMGDNRYKNTLS